MCREEKTAALILSAGSSMRMGEFKPLLRLQGCTVIESAVSCFRGAGISEIIAVIGHRAADMIPLLERIGVAYVINEDYSRGMFSSILAGVKWISGRFSGILLLPVDIPMVRPRTVEVILDGCRRSGKGIIYPSFLGERGHPPYISSKYFGDILSSDPSGNLRSVLSRFGDDSLSVEVVDQSVLMDIDTPEDLQNAESYLSHRNAPSKDECTAIFRKYKTPASVIRHGEAVSGLACRIASLVNERGACSLDLNLVRAGALLHDIARDKADHASAGALLLDQLGYPEVAGVIAGHMDIYVNTSTTAIDETSVVYLADKMIMEDLPVPLEKRFSDSMSRFSGEPDAMKNIKRREAAALIIRERIERLCGLNDLESFLAGEKICL